MFKRFWGSEIRKRSDCPRRTRDSTEMPDAQGPKSQLTSGWRPLFYSHGDERCTCGHGVSGSRSSHKVAGLTFKSSAGRGSGGPEEGIGNRERSYQAQGKLCDSNSLQVGMASCWQPMRDAHTSHLASCKPPVSAISPVRWRDHRRHADASWDRFFVHA